jgi:hypothetical protein
MTDLLMLAVDAHGGLARWNRFKTLNARISMEGALWQAKGHLTENEGLADLDGDQEVLKR